MRRFASAVRCILLLASVFSAAGLAGCGHEMARAERPPVIRVAIQPVYSLAVMSEKYGPLMDYLSEETGYPVEQVSSLTQTNYLSAIEGARADIAFLNPLLYLQVRKTKGAYPLARVLNQGGTDRYRGAIIARDDSAIRSLDQLRGCIAMTSSKKGVSGYLGQYKLLKEHGIDPDRDLTVVVAKTQDEVVRAVFEARAKVGFVREDALSAAPLPGVDPSRMHVIAYTDYFPNWCFVAFSGTDPAVAKAIKEALLGLDPANPSHARILRQAGAAGFVEASPTDYTYLGGIVAELNLPY